MSEDLCWYCDERPRRKKSGGVFEDTCCAECGAKLDALTPAERRQVARDNFRRRTDANLGPGEGQKMLDRIAGIAREDLRKMRGHDA